MKTIMLAATALFASFTINAQTVLNPGDKIPAATTVLQNANGNGKATSLQGAMKENGLLVMFSCNTCPYVIKNETATKKTMEYAAQHKIGMVIINSNEAKRTGDDSKDAMAAFAREQQYSVPYLVDDNSKMADLFGANHTPEIFLFDKTGKLVYKGAMNDNPANPGEVKKVYINEAIDAMIAGKEVDPKVTKSIGCSIKRKA